MVLGILTPYSQEFQITRTYLFQMQLKLHISTANWYYLGHIFIDHKGKRHSAPKTVKSVM